MPGAWWVKGQTGNPQGIRHEGPPTRAQLARRTGSARKRRSQARAEGRAAVTWLAKIAPEWRTPRRGRRLPYGGSTLGPQTWEGRDRTRAFLRRSHRRQGISDRDWAAMPPAERRSKQDQWRGREWMIRGNTITWWCSLSLKA
jgi:hypothetical protein